MTKKKQVGVRFDSNRTRLKTGETQRPNGTYAYRWSTPDGKRHSIYAPTLEKLREQEEQIIVDKHDGIRSDVESITVMRCSIFGVSSKGESRTAHSRIIFICMSCL